MHYSTVIHNSPVREGQCHHPTVIHKRAGGLGRYVPCLGSPSQEGGDSDYPDLLDSKVGLSQYSKLLSNYQRANVTIW